LLSHLGFPRALGPEAVLNPCGRKERKDKREREKERSRQKEGGREGRKE
jgi:hypothetical protein